MATNMDQRVLANIKVIFCLNHSETCIAKPLSKLPVDIIESDYASVSLKQCVLAIVTSRPELLEDSDYSITCLDVQETDLNKSRRMQAVKEGLPLSPVKSEKIWEGKGLMTWSLQEAEGDHQTTVIGKYDPKSNWLSVNLQLNERKTLSKTNFLDSLRTPLSQPCQTQRPSSSETPSFAMNVIHPTPARPSDMYALSGAIPSSSSPLQTLKSNPGTLPEQPDKNQIMSLLSTLLPQLQHASSSDGKSEVLPLLQTLVTYVSSSAATEATPSAMLDTAHVGLGVSLPGGPMASRAPSPAPVLKPSQSPSPAPSPLSASPILTSTSTFVPATAPKSAGTAASVSEDHGDSSGTKKKRRREESNEQETKPTAATSQEQPAKKPKRLKFDAVGCMNCSTHYSRLWRKKKSPPSAADGGQVVSKLCNSCGVYFNKKGMHRPVTEAMRQGTHIEESDDEHVVPNSMARSKAREHVADVAVTSPRRSPRNHASHTSHHGTKSSPGQVSKRPRPVPTCKKLEKVPPIDFFGSHHGHNQPSSRLTSSSTATSAVDASFLFSEVNYDPHGSDIFSALTSDMDFPGFGSVVGDSRESNKLSLDATHDWSSVNLDSLFPPSDNNVLPSDFSDMDVPPSSPPNRHANPFAHLAASETGDSPNWPAEPTTAAASTSASVTTTAPESKSPASQERDILARGVAILPEDEVEVDGVKWSPDAIAALVNAFTVASGRPLEMSLEDSTLQDLLASLTSALSPPKSSEASDIDANSKINVSSVAAVNASVALDIWNKEVSAHMVGKKATLSNPAHP